jgi:hypothetical protein
MDSTTAWRAVSESISCASRAGTTGDKRSSLCGMTDIDRIDHSVLYTITLPLLDDVHALHIDGRARGTHDRDTLLLGQLVIRNSKRAGAA